MSVVAVPRVGPRDKGQQTALWKWSVPLANDYWLYLSAPKSVYSQDASSNDLLIGPSAGKRAIDVLMTHANALVSKERPSDRPSRLKVYYKTYETPNGKEGDTQPVPQVPEVTGQDGKTRKPTEEEIEFTVACATILPMYDVTLRENERKEAGWLLKMLGKIDAVPFNLESSRKEINVGFDALFDDWWSYKHDLLIGPTGAMIDPKTNNVYGQEKKLYLEGSKFNTMSLSQFLAPANMDKFEAGDILDSGFLAIKLANGVSALNLFSKIVAFDVAGKDGEPFCTKLCFCHSDDGEKNIAFFNESHTVITIMHDPNFVNDPILEIRFLKDELLHRHPVKFDVSIMLTPGKRASKPQLFFPDLTSDIAGANKKIISQAKSAALNTTLIAGDGLLTVVVAPLGIALAPVVWAYDAFNAKKKF
jgi:hypothetical protein